MTGGRFGTAFRGGFRTRPYAGWRVVGGALAGGSGPDLAPAHGHGVYEVEQLSGGDGLRRAVLLAAVLAHEDGGEGAVFYPEPAPGGGGSFGGVLEKGLGQKVAVLGGGFVAFQQPDLADVGLVPGGGGEDEEAAVAGRGLRQDCPLARSEVCWAALA